MLAATAPITDPAATIAHVSGDQQFMQCMEVWGGNDVVDAGVAMSGLDAWVYSKPYEQAQAGGDVYYVSSCATGRITRLLVADVAGHGASVRDTATTLRNLMRRYVNHLDQTQFVRSMNRKFVAMSAAGHFATAIVLTFFGPTNHLTLCNAGHPAPLLFRAKTRQWSLIDQRGERAVSDQIVNIPLGIEDAVDYEQFGLSLEPGDLVLCYSDSLIESRKRDGEMLGEAGLLALIGTIDASDPATLTAKLLNTIRELSPDNLDGDDVTVLLFRANGPTNAATFKRTMLAPLRFLRAAFHGEIALPDLKLANIGGAIIGALNRSWTLRGR